MKRQRFLSSGSLCALGLACLAACGTLQKRFEIHAINDRREPVKCLIVVEGNWPIKGDPQSKPVYTTDGRQSVMLKFTNEQTPVEVQVIPCLLADGKTEEEIPTLESKTYYRKPPPRDVYYLDRPDILFVLVVDRR